MCVFLRKQIKCVNLHTKYSELYKIRDHGSQLFIVGELRVSNLLNYLFTNNFEVV